jgi:hypothetical protein
MQGQVSKTTPPPHSETSNGGEGEKTIGYPPYLLNIAIESFPLFWGVMPELAPLAVPGQLQEETVGGNPNHHRDESAATIRQWMNRRKVRLYWHCAFDTDHTLYILKELLLVVLNISVVSSIFIQMNTIEKGKCPFLPGRKKKA